MANPNCLPVLLLTAITGFTAGASILNPPPSPLPPPSAPDSPLKPSFVVLVGVLTTMFSLTLLLLLYARHCRRGNVAHSGDGPAAVLSAGCGRKNSGIDRTIIESLPVFRFGSLSGQKDGLQCAVCLNRFDPDEVLRLLPKCNHAFHVECVDTWLDAHSTCPLCRIRVDPEDILLRLHHKLLISQQSEEKEVISVRRVSGRHSSAGEGGTGLLQITIDPSTPAAEDKRRSLDSWNHHHHKKTRKAKKKNAPIGDSSAVVVGCLERHRKDGLLLEEAEKRSCDRRFEHRIVVCRGGAVHQKQRWSDVQPSDLLYLRSEMILSDSSRLSGSRPLDSWKKQNGIFIAEGNNNSGWQGGRNVINSRSVSEIIGLNRFRS